MTRKNLFSVLRNISLPGSIRGKKKTVLTYCLIAAIMIDTLLSNTSDLFHKELTSVFGVAFFILITVSILTTGQYFLVSVVSKVTKDPRIRKPDLRVMYKAILLGQYVLMAILILLIIEMVASSNYSVVWIAIATQISYALASIMTATLSYRFFSWYRSDKRNIMILLYGLAAATTAIVTGAGGLAQNALLLQAHVSIIGPQSLVEFPKISVDPSGIMGPLLSMAYGLAIIAYLLTWAASFLLLRHYSQGLGRLRYFISISIPLAVFLFAIIPILLALPADSTYFAQNLLLNRILSIGSLVSVAVLFGSVFLSIAKSIRHETHTAIVDYLSISGYGVAMLFVSLAANLAHGAYPPFGIASYSITALASYFFVSGIYSSAIIVAADSNLRQSIKRYAVNECKLLDSIGVAQMTQELEGRVLKTVREYSDTITKQSGVEPMLSDEDAKHYLEVVLNEIQSAKTRSSNDKNADKGRDKDTSN